MEREESLRDRRASPDHGQGYLRFATFAACFPSAVRVFLGRCAMVCFLFAAAAAFLMFLRAAFFCFAVAYQCLLKYWTSRSCFFAAARDLNVPRFLR